jgi:sec-independent protein translocase protein TatC
MHILDHLRELRQRVIGSLIALVIGAAVAFLFADPIVALFTAQFENMAAESSLEARLFLGNVTEGFVIRLKLALIAGAVLALPVILYNIIRFIFPGLKKRERRATLIALVVCLLLAVGGFSYAYTQIIPLSIGFLTSGEFVPDRVGVLLNYASNVNFVLQLLLIAVLLFQLPVVMVTLMRLRVLSRRAALRASRYVIVAILLLSAILTPPDVISQVFLAVPLVGLYFLAILVARIFRFGAEEA